MTEEEVIQDEVDKIRASELFKLMSEKVNSFRMIDWEKIYTRSRRRVHVEPRQLMLYFLKTHTNHTLALLGAVFDRDHATVLHAEKTVLHLHDTNKSWEEFIKQTDLDIKMFLHNKKKKVTTRFGLFKELAENCVQDHKVRNEWIHGYLNAKL